MSPLAIMPWAGIFGSAKVPKDILERLAKETAAVVARPGGARATQALRVRRQELYARETATFPKGQVDVRSWSSGISARRSSPPARVRRWSQAGERLPTTDRRGRADRCTVHAKSHSTMARVTASGCSKAHMWPQFGTTARRARVAGRGPHLGVRASHPRSRAASRPSGNGQRTFERGPKIRRNRMFESALLSHMPGTAFVLCSVPASSTAAGTGRSRVDYRLDAVNRDGPAAPNDGRTASSVALRPTDWTI